MNGKIIINSGSLHGQIKSGCLKGSITNGGSLTGGKVNISTEHEYYAGDYNITPEITERTLDTTDKILNDDIKIKAIPFYSVTNIQNGETVVIGGNI